MDISWDDAKLFLAVMDEGSLSAAARKLKLTQPTVSRRLAELEALLGEPLFDRAVGGATLTEYGTRLAPPAQKMADWAGELTRVAEQKKASSGVVRITAPPGVAESLLLPFAAAFSEAAPNIQLHVVSTVRTLDLARREADLALRLGAADDPEAVATIDLELRPYASEGYAKGLSPTDDPSQLAWIGWAPPYDDLSPNAYLRRLVPAYRLAFASDDYLLQVRACELGLGAMLLARPHPRFGSQSKLVPLSVALPPVRTSLTLICPRSARAIARVRTVVDALTLALKEWDCGESGGPRAGVAGPVPI